MSLAITSLWRARGCSIRAGGLSLIPREQHDLSFRQSSRRRWGSKAVRKKPPRSPYLPKLPIIRPPEAPKGSKHVVWKAPKAKPPPDGIWYQKGNRIRVPKRPEETPQEAAARALRKEMIKKKFGFRPPKRPELVRRPGQYLDQQESKRSLQKHNNSVARQGMLDERNKARDTPGVDWSIVFDFMLRHTLDVSEILHFRVIIGRGVAAEAREKLMDPDTNINHICRRNETLVHVEELNPENGELAICLSGSEESLRKSILDILEVLGTITAVRITESGFDKLLWDIWKLAQEKRPELQFIPGNDELTLDERALTVQTSVLNSAKYKDYELTTRADEISRPTVWTRESFEKYVAALVHGQVPTHLAQSLYPEHPNHQETVVSLLLDLFASEQAKSAITLSALKMAIRFIESRGDGFRYASRAITTQAELLALPMDAEIFNIFLVSASKAKDIDHFYSILKSMVRKGFHVQSRAWIAFMEMIHDPSTRRYIVGGLKIKGLTNNPSILRAVGRQMVTTDLEHRLSMELNVVWFLNEQNKKYGVGWLDTITLNRMLDTLGAHGLLATGYMLLDQVKNMRLTLPSAVTLNTMLTHSKGLAARIHAVRRLLEMWPKLALDPITYLILFKAAWRQRSVNLIRVIWRYAAVARMTTPKMRYMLTKLLHVEEPSNNVRRMNEWEDTIFGREELAEMRAIHSDELEASHLIRKYLEGAEGMQFEKDFPTMLEEAHKKDLEIHELLRDDTVASVPVIESHTVPIRMIPKQEMQTRDQPDPVDVWSPRKRVRRPNWGLAADPNASNNFKGPGRGPPGRRTNSGRTTMKLERKVEDPW